jgi:hypothetical protein
MTSKKTNAKTNAKTKAKAGPSTTLRMTSMGKDCGIPP